MEDARSTDRLAPSLTRRGSRRHCLSRPVDEPTRHALTRALADHLVLVFHDQSFKPAEYLTAANRRLGVRTADGAALLTTQHGGLSSYRSDMAPKRSAAGGAVAHHTNRERPPAATILYGVAIPSAGGGTSIANMRAAYAQSHPHRRNDSRGKQGLHARSCSAG